MATEADNLDARMEAIRLKNEELEKKHREIMEDELNAKRENAVVNLKEMGKDIPKVHPYDNVELDFDVKDTEKELAKNPETAKPKNRRPMPRKEFLDEIPPDPVNFLREDGDDSAPKPEPNQRQQNNKNNRNNRNRPERQRSNNEGGNSNSGDSPPRPRNQNNNQRPRQPPQQQQQQRSPQQADGSSPRKPPQQLRNERRSLPPQGDNHETGNSQQQPNRQRRPNNRAPNKEGNDIKNITVQVTDGEVRSVKVKSERSFGTGRVGHSRGPNDNGQKFAVDTFNPENAETEPRTRNPRNNQNRRTQKPREFQHPTLENMIIPKASVQDRLLKIAKDSEAPTTEAGN